MPLEPGRQLGPYQIAAPRGAGGMGEVYKATDTRLERTVAIKVLPEHVASDPDLKQRFEREARTIAALNHANICTLYDIGQEDGTDFLVMEYLDGETLAQRLEKGALPLEQALKIATDIADALDKAHRQGIVHRDLKPGNIMLTKAAAKLLDFGLAKLRKSGLIGGPAVSAAATRSESLTSQGTIVGTVQYMAPEQLEGKDADPRTDIFAFGAVLYEMITGEKTFRGESQASLIAAIMHTEAPVPSTTQPVAPPALDYVVQTCLAKNPEDRWHSAGDVKRQLKWIVGGSGSQASAVVADAALHRPTGWRQAVPWVGGMVAAGLVAGLAVWSLPPGPPRQVVRSTISLSGDAQLYTNPTWHPLALSPDGQRLAFSAGGVAIRELAQLEATPLGGVSSPFFSPDGASIGYSDQDSLVTLSLAGGTPETVWSGPNVVESASWGANDVIVFGTQANGGLLRISASGGEAEPVTTLATDQGETDHRWPELLPGGEALLPTVWSRDGYDRAQIAVKDLVTGERRRLLAGSFPRYASSGHLVFVRDTTLWAVPFDVDRLELTGDPVDVLAGINTFTNGNATFAVASNGSLVYLPWFPRGYAGEDVALVWVDRQGNEESIDGAPRFSAFFGGVRLSPDGQRVVGSVVQDGDVSNVVIYDLVRETPTQVTVRPENGSEPAWSPDGQRVVFTSYDGAYDIYWKAADGTGQVEQLTTTANAKSSLFFEPNGETFFFAEVRPGTNADLGMLAVEDRTVEWPLATPAYETDAALSPDGQWIAYASNLLGRSTNRGTGGSRGEIYVSPFPNVGDERYRISTDGGLWPVWGPDGRELFYQLTQQDDETATMMVVAVQTEPMFSAGLPEVLLEGPYASATSDLDRRVFDISADGRFLMLKRGDTDTTELREAGRPDLVLVQNWLEELKRLVPVD